MKDEFLAMLAHELRNPLAPITSAAQLLRLPEVPLQSRQDKPQPQSQPARVPVGASR